MGRDDHVSWYVYAHGDLVNHYMAEESSTLSVTTSFLAAALTLLRSSYYALGYAANDIVLIILWVFASLKNPAYLPVAANFMIFFFNDLYGFVSWKKRETANA